LVAFSVRVSCPAIGTAADWPVRTGFTLGILPTRRIFLARIATFISNACPVIRTVIVNFALSLEDWNTLTVRISCEARWAFANCPVIVYCALST
jgi:hypothetical protein